MRNQHKSILEVLLDSQQQNLEKAGEIIEVLVEEFMTSILVNADKNAHSEVENKRLHIVESEKLLNDQHLRKYL